MSKERSIRGFNFPCDFFGREEFLDLYLDFPRTTEWFLRLVVIAREAINGGRIEVGGKPVKRDKMRHHLPDLDPAWLDLAVNSGLLEEREDAYFIPNSHEWFYDGRKETDKPTDISDFPEWGKFLERWYKDFGQNHVSSSQLHPLVTHCGMKFLDRITGDSERAKSVGKILCTTAGRSINGYTVSVIRTPGRSNEYTVAPTELVKLVGVGLVGHHTIPYQPTPTTLHPTPNHEQYMNKTVHTTPSTLHSTPLHSFGNGGGVGATGGGEGHEKSPFSPSEDQTTNRKQTKSKQPDYEARKKHAYDLLYDRADLSHRDEASLYSFLEQDINAEPAHADLAWRLAKKNLQMWCIPDSGVSFKHARHFLDHVEAEYERLTQ